MITDRLTARILGILLIALPFITVVSGLFFVRSELRFNPGFLAFFVATSAPFFIGGSMLLRRAARMKSD
ncbi:MAG: hypothetical protein FWD73_12675 [Polyangiaceae bacterium]|nr:hypothetical protein [Polyangiaceae bacterium]